MTFVLGCPGFTDDWSGTYRQIVPAGESPAHYLEIEVFRYGHDAQAIVRFFEPPDPASDLKAFEKEDRCGWTDPASIDEDGVFETFVRSTPQQASVRVELDDTGGAVTLTTAQETADYLLQRMSPTPDSDCRTIAPKRVTADLGGLTGANEFPANVYTLRAPYFGVQWLAVEPVRRSGGLTVFAALTAELTAGAISDKMTENKRGLAGNLTIYVEPPPEDFRTADGTTRYSLAHFIVVDDDPADGGPFVWDKGEEPIVASGVRRGTRPDAPAFVGDHDQFGRAVLFVEGALTQLGDDTLDSMEGWESVDPEEHLYVVEVFADGDRVTGIRFPENRQSEIPVVVVSDYLEAAQVPLPRLFPGGN